MRRLKFGVNVILIAGFGLAMTAISLPFAAEITFSQAKKLENVYRWKKAGETYQAAAHLCPFNADYFAGAGDFMIGQGEYRRGKDRLSWLKRAEKLYQRAGQLNPRYAEYWYLLGKAQIMQITDADYTDRKVGDRDKIGSVIENFSKAIDADPYNFRNNYLIGHNLLSVWDVLDDEEKAFTRHRLKYVLRSRPDYGRHVYPAALYYAGDFTLAQELTPQSLAGYEALLAFIAKSNLWQFRKEVARQLDFCRQKEQPDEVAREKEEKQRLLYSFTMRGEEVGWAGRSKDRKNTYQNGNMYWTGTMDRVIELPRGEARIGIMAMGTSANDVFPYMIVGLDAEEIGEAFVDGPEWKEYSFDINTDGGIKVLSIIFPNDLCLMRKGRREDRNLHVGNVKIDNEE